MIAVIQGGHESEAEISRMTSKAFQQALDGMGHEYKVFEYGENLRAELGALKPELCLNAMHGKFGEDGVVQKLLEDIGIPYSGSGVEASELSFDKTRSIAKAREQGVPTLPSFSCTIAHPLNSENLEVIASWVDGYVVKPAQSGSSRGVSLCSDISEMGEALVESYKWDKVALIEKKLIGRELTVSVLENRAFDVIEIRPKTGFYDMKNKYTKGATDYLVPAPISESAKKKLQDGALKIFKSFGLKTYGRVDFLMTNDEESFYFMEVNTLPGCTPTSLFPKALAAGGLPFENLIKTLIESAKTSA
jgi:D-alanine-D-alanine ligase